MNRIFIAAAFCLPLLFLAASGQSQPSGSELDQLVRQCPDLSSAYAMRGRFFLKKLNYAMAADDFRKAASIEQDRDDLHLWLGKALFISGNHQKAAESFDQAAAIADKKFVEIHKTRGEAYLAKVWMTSSPADADKIIESFDKVLLLHPDSAEAYYGRGRGFFAKAYFTSGDYTKAVEDLKKAVALKPGFQEAEKELEAAILHQALRAD